MLMQLKRGGIAGSAKGLMGKIGRVFLLIFTGTEGIKMREEKQKESSLILTEWENAWNHKSLVDWNGKENDCFFDTFVKAYQETCQKKTQNKRKNFLWKTIFVLLMLLDVFLYIINIVHFLMFFGNLIFLSIFSLLVIIIQWLDIKNYQETWVRHSKQQYFLEKEMLQFIYQLKPYDSFRKEEVFVMRIMTIWDMNQNKFGANMEEKEESMRNNMDYLNFAKKL